MKGVVIPLNDIGQKRIAAVKESLETLGVIVEMKVNPGAGCALRFVDECDAHQKLPCNDRGELLIPYDRVGDNWEGYVVYELPPREMGGTWFRLR